MQEPRLDLLYVAFNRLEFTVESFDQLIRNTDWSLVRRLYVHDDGSTDGTAEWLETTIEKRLPLPLVEFQTVKLGGPVAATNWYLDETKDDPIEIFGKIDNDFVVCPDWLTEMLRVLDEHPHVDILGTEPFVGGPIPTMFHPDADGTVPDACLHPGRTITEASHIGGKGLIRRRAFDHPRSDRMWADGYQGFTQWQHRNTHLVKAWITPDLPCFGLDQIPDDAWQAVTDGYVENGWQRRWGPYHPKSAYHLWWKQRVGCEEASA
jgi:glycosyltransferase involved in cell wall biosynthesis